MDTLAKGETQLKLPPAETLGQARAFLAMSKRLHDIPATPSSSSQVFISLHLLPILSIHPLIFYIAKYMPAIPFVVRRAIFVNEATINGVCFLHRLPHC
jgi:hypothetical protein